MCFASQSLLTEAKSLTQKRFTITQKLKENTMPNYILSLIGMAAIVTVSSIVCGFLMYKNEQDHEKDI